MPKEVPTPQMTCPAKHTDYDPLLERFYCPECGATNGDFYVEAFYPGCSKFCGKLHDEDRLYCSDCKFKCTGKALVKKLLAKKNLSICLTCHGTGTVPKEPPPQKEKNR